VIILIGYPVEFIQSFFNSHRLGDSGFASHSIPALRAEEIRHLYGVTHIKPLAGAFCYALARNFLCTLFRICETITAGKLLFSWLPSPVFRCILDHMIFK
jgi:hypothetical protein